MAITQTFDAEQYASKLDEIGSKLPNLVGDHNALIAYGAELKGLAQRVRNPEDVRPNPAGQPDVRPAYKDLHGDGQDEAMRPKYRLKDDPNAPMHLPIAEQPAVKTIDEKPDNETNVANKVKYGTGSDTQKGAGKPGKL